MKERHLFYWTCFMIFGNRRKAKLCWLLTKLGSFQRIALHWIRFPIPPTRLASQRGVVQLEERHPMVQAAQHRDVGSLQRWLQEEGEGRACISGRQTQATATHPSRYRSSQPRVPFLLQNTAAPTPNCFILIGERQQPWKCQPQNAAYITVQSTVKL